MGDTQQTPAEPKAVFGDPNLLPHGEANLNPLAQLKRIQRVIYEVTQEQDVDKRALAALACAWERLEERKRVMTGKPAPKPVDTTEKERERERRRAERQAAGTASNWRKPKVQATAPVVEAPMPTPPPEPSAP